MTTIVLLVSGSTDVTGHFNIDVEVIACRITVMETLLHMLLYNDWSRFPDSHILNYSNYMISCLLFDQPR